MSNSKNNEAAAETDPEPTVNVNGLTAEQQADYDTFCADHPEYNPDRPIRTADRHFGVPAREKYIPQRLRQGGRGMHESRRYEPEVRLQ